MQKKDHLKLNSISSFKMNLLNLFKNISNHLNIQKIIFSNILALVYKLYDHMEWIKDFSLKSKHFS